MTDKYEIPDEPVDINGEWMKIETEQAATIERLADALEFVLAYADVTDEGQANWQKYTAKRWPNGLNVGQLHDALTSARALLAEIRGKHE